MSVFPQSLAALTRDAPLRPVSALRTEPVAPLRIAVINNMSDSGMRRTERHLCSLLHAASAGLLVDLRFYVLPGGLHSKAASAHIESCYDSLQSLESMPPDGLIVTGAEPRAARFEDEWFWPAMSRLIDWVDAQRVPAIWSCLAAHAAIYHRDGIERTPLATKLSGVFSCSIDTRRHQLLHGLPHRWKIPHSRCNGVSRRQLDRHGYEVLSWSREVAVDMFIRHDRSLQLHLQGHPEYDCETLSAEYQRDLLRAQHSQNPVVVKPPVGVDRTLYDLKTQMPHGFPMSTRVLGAATSRVGTQWSPSAHRLFSNWLAYVESVRNPAMRSTQAVLF